MKTPIRRPSRRAAAVMARPVDSLVVYRADRQIALERRHFLFKLQDPIIESLHGRRLNCRDRPVKLAQGPSPSSADGRWRLYCSHVRSRKLGRNSVLALTDALIRCYVTSIEKQAKPVPSHTKVICVPKLIRIELKSKCQSIAI